VQYNVTATKSTRPTIIVNGFAWVKRSHKWKTRGIRQSCGSVKLRKKNGENILNEPIWSFPVWKFAKCTNWEKASSHGCRSATCDNEGTFSESDSSSRKWTCTVSATSTDMTLWLMKLRCVAMHALHGPPDAPVYTWPHNNVRRPRCAQFFLVHAEQNFSCNFLSYLSIISRTAVICWSRTSETRWYRNVQRCGTSRWPVAYRPGGEPSR